MVNLSDVVAVIVIGCIAIGAMFLIPDKASEAVATAIGAIAGFMGSKVGQRTIRTNDVPPPEVKP